MKLPVLALFSRSLRLEARAMGTYGLRFGLLALMLMTLFTIERTARYGMLGAPGLQLFKSLTIINFWFVSLAALVYFASAITEEKEEMTLGLLRMTRLNPVAILLGKSTSRLVGAAMLLFVQLPFTMLAVTLGGVAPRQIFAAVIALLAYVFLLCNVALLHSVIFNRTRIAATFTALTMIVLLFGPTILSGIILAAGSAGRIQSTAGNWPGILALLEWFHTTSAWLRIREILGTGFTGPLFGLQFWSNLGFGAFCFLFAWALFEICTREQKDDAPSRGIGLRLRLPQRTRSLPVPAWAIRGRAITWKDFVVISGGRWGLLIKFIAFGAAIGALGFSFATVSGQRLNREAIGGSLIVISLIVTGIMIAVEVSRVFRHEVRWKTLSALMILPLSTREIAYRKIIGCLSGTLPFLAWSVVGAMVCPENVADVVREISREWKQSSSALLFILVWVSQYVLFLHLVAFLSLLLKRGALLLAFGIQYIAGSFLLMPVMFMVSIFRMNHSLLMLLAVVVDVVLIVLLHIQTGRLLVRAAAAD